MSTKFTALSQIASLSLDDIVCVVDDVAGTPTSKKSALSYFGLLTPRLNQGRLTLVSGVAAYDPQPQTASATDTGAETADFAAAHGWATGTTVFLRSSVGGLTANTTYYIRAVDTDTVSFHTTLADAIANTNKVNLTSDIAGTWIYPLGVQQTTIYYTPLLGTTGYVTVPDGTNLIIRSFTERSLALGTLTSGAIYDVFLYDVGGTLTLKLGPAWSSATAGASARGTGAGTTELEYLFGCPVNKVSITSGPGALAGRYLGSIMAISTAAAEDSLAKRFVWNADRLSQVDRLLLRQETAVSWSYSGSTWQQANGNAANQVEVLTGLPSETVALVLCVAELPTADTPAVFTIGVNSTTPASRRESLTTASNASGTSTRKDSVGHQQGLPLGYNYFTWLEIANGVNSSTFYGQSISEFSGVIRA